MSGRLGISLAYTALEAKPDLARLADEAGFEFVWNSGESVPLFAAMGALTKKAKIGSGVVHGFSHDPLYLAQEVADLQALTGNRFILGLGGGTKRSNINRLGKEYDHPATRLREFIALLRQSWNTPAGQPFTFDGTYYQESGKGSRGSGKPAEVYLAAVNKDMFRLAGEVCDGLCGHPIASVKFINEFAWPHIDQGLKKAGRTRADFDHASWVITAISRDREQAKREAKFHMGRFMATRSYSLVLETQGWKKEKEEIQHAFFSTNEDFETLVAAVPDEIAEAHAIYGTPDEVREQFKRYDGVIDTPTFYSAGFSMTPERVKENIEFIIETFGKK